MAMKIFKVTAGQGLFNILYDRGQKDGLEVVGGRRFVNCSTDCVLIIGTRNAKATNRSVRKKLQGDDLGHCWMRVEKCRARELEAMS